MESRSPPARVYPAFEGAQDWVVEPPAAYASTLVEPKAFTGHAVLFKALEHAYDTYGSVLHLSC
jgi:hypothetical protein